jgi:hypothetical protein
MRRDLAGGNQIDEGDRTKIEIEAPRLGIKNRAQRPPPSLQKTVP